MILKVARLRAVDSLSAVVALLALCVQVRASCPSDWNLSPENNMCYMLPRYGKFDEMLTFCQAHGGTIYSNLQRMELRVAIEPMIATKSDRFWVGMEDKGKGEGLKLLDGQPVPDSLDWKDDKKPESSQTRMCGYVDPNDLKLGSTRCDQSLKVVCERETVSCPDHWYPIAGDCMRIFTDKRSWEGAKKACIDMGASPMKVPTLDHATAVWNNLKLKKIPDEYQFWTGAKDSIWDDGTFVTENSKLKRLDTTKDASAAGCGFISATNEEVLLTSTQDCKVHKDYACFFKGGSPEPETLPTPNPNICSEEFTIISDTCLWRSSYKATWKKAKEECDQMKAKLFIAQNEDDQFDLLEILDADYYWIGVTRNSYSDALEWTDGGIVSGGGNQEEPGSYPGPSDANCGLATSGSNSVNYYQEHCDTRKRFICQKDQDKNAPKVEKLEAPEVSQGSCGDGWEERPGTDTCYSFIDNNNVLSLQAEEVCSSKGGHLVSINSLYEEDYLSGRLQYMTEPIFWIGVKHSYLAFQGWSWTDGSPFAYIGWAAGQPSHEGVGRIGYLSTSDMKWSVVSEKDEVYAAVICEKHLNDDEPSAITTPKPRLGEFYECDEHWFGYENSCYFISTNKKTWSEARDACLDTDADLASIEYTEVNEFIYSIFPKGCTDSDPKCDEWKEKGDCKAEPVIMGGLCAKTCEFCDGDCKDSWDGYCGYYAKKGECDQKSLREICQWTCGCDDSSQEGYWIGLNAQRTVQQYEWSDKSKIMKTTPWSDNEPDNYEGKGEECVVMHRPTGQWSDKPCDEKRTGFICEKPKTFKTEKIEDPTTVGCPDGARGYADKCYIVVNEKVVWSKAKENCEQNFQGLAILNDNLVNSYVEAMLFERSIKVSWIGLNYDKNSPRWIDGSVPTYMDTFENQDLSDGQCGAVADDGYWKSYDCKAELRYVCETHRDGYTTLAPTQPPPSMTPAPCPGGWTGFRDICFKIFPEKKKWHEASEVCNRHGGSLVSIPDDDTRDAIAQINLGSNLHLTMWIGLIQENDGEGFAWSDGTAYTIHNWGSLGPDDSMKAPTCAMINLLGSWTATSCHDESAFMCQVYGVQGIFRPDTTAFIAPVKFCEEEDENGHKWREFAGQCYHISTYDLVDWRQAREKCIEKDADLASIHSIHENDFITELVKEAWFDACWIGYNELGLTHYAWTDRTTENYFHWNDGEPNDAYGAEKCVNMYGHNGKWNDADCVNRFGYICKKREGPQPPPTLPTEVKGVCPDGFKSERFSKRCYYYSGDDQKETWEDAHKACEEKYKQAELATIGGSIDQAFVTLLVEESNAEDIWIGFNSRADFSEWKWIDNSVGRFTHWDDNRSYSYWSRSSDENCAVIQRNTENVASIGTWLHASCSQKKPYLCQALRVPGGGEDKNPFEDQYNTAKCTGDDSFLYHGRCYTFYNSNKTWTDARDFCKQKSSELPVLMDTFEGARLNYEAYFDGAHTKFWTDVRFEKNLYRFVWGKDRDVPVTPWDWDEPDQPLDSCVAYLDGHWYNELCSEEKPFFCVDGDYNDDFSKPQPSDLQCESPNHEPHGNKCYWIPSKKTATWSAANEQCKTKGMSLASIHSLDEAKFINDLLKNTRGDKKNAWIGFQSGATGAFRWSDGSPVNFLYWDQFKEKTTTNVYQWSWMESENCVEMMLDQEGKWNKLTCNEPLAYVCSKDKVAAKSVEADSSPDAGGEIGTGKDLEPQQSDKTDPDDKQKTGKTDADDTQKPAKTDADDTQQPAKTDTDDTQQPAKTDTDDTQQPAKTDTDDTQQPAKTDTDDTQQPAKTDTDPDTSADRVEESKKPAKPIVEGDKPDSQDQDHSDGGPGSSKDGRIDGEGQQNKQKSTDDGKKGQMSGGAIAGVIFGVLAVLALVLVAVFVVRRRWPLWRLESILRGNNSSENVAFHNNAYSPGDKGDGGVVDFGQHA